MDSVLLDHLVSDVATRGYSAQKSYVSEEFVLSLATDLLHLRSAGLFRRAGVGQAQNHAVRNDVRSDEVLWFDPDDLTPAQSLWWSELDKIRQALNERLTLGLWSFEGHYAHYAPGGFYQKHVDRFRSDDARTISIVLYLNQRWENSSGGELIIYDQDKEVLIPPEGGTLVAFLSEHVAHEVRPAQNRARMSFAGWFKRRPLSL